MIFLVNPNGKTQYAEDCFGLESGCHCDVTLCSAADMP